MKQAEVKKKRRKRSAISRRMMLYRRIGAGLLAALAVALGVVIFGMTLNLSSLMLAVACALLILEALTLWVRLPVSRALQGVLAVLCLVLLATGFVSYYYRPVDGRLVPKYTLVTRIRVTDKYPAHFEQMQMLETLDMQGSTVTDFTPIQSLSALKRLDIRDNYAFTRQDRDALAQALPGCDIRWSVPVQNAHFDSAAEVVDLTGLSLSAAELRALFADYPETRFAYYVPLMDQRVAPNAESLALQGMAPDVAALEEALTLLPAVRSVDLRGVPAPASTVAALCDAHPDIHFMFSCQVPSGEMTTEDAEVTVQGSYEDLTAYLAYVDYMPNLTKIDASAVELTSEQADAIAPVANTGKLLYSFSAFGVMTSTLATELNLDNMPVPSVEAMEDCLKKLPNLEKVSMCGCGLSEDDMGRLFDAHPNIKFIWWLEFGHYRLRTDATAFTTGLGTGNRYGYNDDTFACLRYCTDLMMLDLGHNHCTSLENFKDLKKLRVLIMADNQLTDISPVAGMEDLEYVEFFLNDIKDLTPLTGLTHLVDLNVFYNPLYENYKVLESMTWLERLWIGGCRLSNDDIRELKKALPNTKINTKGRGSTGHGWRSHPHYDTLKQMYEEERYIPFDS